MQIRLDKLVAERFGLSRRGAQEALRNGRIDLDGSSCDEGGRLVEPSALVEYYPDRPKRRAVKSRLTVLYEDRDVIIVDKPAGLLTLPTENHERITLLSRVERYLVLRHGGRHFVGVIHRLDKNTSGAIAFARTPEALRAFQSLFKRHDVDRRYVAVVEGVPNPAKSLIDRPLVADPQSLRRRTARAGESGRPARTHYQVIESFGDWSLLECRLETGRTHQIRVHLSSIGHPVVGDLVYRPRRRPTRAKATFPRQALHAQTLGFRHPKSGEVVQVESEIPADLQGLLATLRSRSSRAGLDHPAV
jgi:23S rRNA pseudouridine1911/1915/1917 synthase